jgi:hypothetical protein
MCADTQPATRYTSTNLRRPSHDDTEWTATATDVEIDARSWSVVEDIPMDDRLRSHGLEPRARLLLPDPHLFHNVAFHDRSITTRF